MKAATTLAALALCVGTSLTWSPETASAAATCQGKIPTITAVANSDIALGTEGDDVIWADGATSVTSLGGDDTICVSGVPWVDLGDGDDTVAVTPRAGVTVSVAGGAGEDRFEADFVDRVAASIDLSTGVAALDGLAYAIVTDIENVRLRADRGVASVRGTVGPNTLEVTSVDGRVRGLGGDDRIIVAGCGLVARGGPGNDYLRSTRRGCSNNPVRLIGGPGKDTLVGSTGADVLIGGDGRDAATGNRGRDRCRAEVRRTCEYRPDHAAQRNSGARPISLSE